MAVPFTYCQNKILGIVGIYVTFNVGRKILMPLCSTSIYPLSLQLIFFNNMGSRLGLPTMSE